MLAYVLLRLARIYGDDELERRAVGVLRLARATASTRAPSAFGWALCALDLHLSPPRELAIVGSPDDEVARAALAPFDPNAVVAFGPAEDVPLLAGKDAASTASRRSTSASASPARRRSRTPPSCNLPEQHVTGCWLEPAGRAP